MQKIKALNYSSNESKTKIRKRLKQTRYNFYCIGSFHCAKSRDKISGTRAGKVFQINSTKK